MATINLYGTLTSAVGLPIVNTDEVKDLKLNMTQEAINQIAISGSSASIDIKDYLNSSKVLPKAAAYTNGDVPCMLSATAEGPNHVDHTLYILSCTGQMSASNGIAGKTVYVFDGDANSDGWVYRSTVEFSDEASYRSNTDILKAFGLILPEATTTFSGLMSKEDKAKLDNLADNYEGCTIVDIYKHESFSTENDNIFIGHDDTSAIQYGPFTPVYGEECIVFLVSESSSYFDHYPYVVYKKSGNTYTYYKTYASEDEIQEEFGHTTVSGCTNAPSRFETESTKTSFNISIADAGNHYTSIPLALATSTTAGIMSGDDKAKLDKISLTATGQIETTCVEEVTYDAATRVLTVKNANDAKVTCTLPLATTTNAGLLSADDYAIISDRAFASIDTVNYGSTDEGGKITITETEQNGQHPTSEVTIPLATSEKNGLLDKSIVEDLSIFKGLSKVATGLIIPNDDFSISDFEDNESNNSMSSTIELSGINYAPNGQISSENSWSEASSAIVGTVNISYAVADKNGGVITKNDKAVLDNVANLKLVFKNGQLALTDGTNDYLIDAYSKTPTTPGLTASQTFELVKNAKATITFTNKDSKTCTLTINGVDSGQAATASVEPGKTITRTITCTAENESARFAVSVTATRNGQTSTAASAEYVVKRKVNTPIVTVSGDKYDKARTITASTATSGSTIQYSTGSSFVDMPSSGITISSDITSRAYGFKGVQAEWVDSDNAYTDAIQVGKLPVYVGFGAATLSNEAAITSMEGVQKVKKDTPAGTYNVTNTTTGKYFWICSAGTVSKVTSSGFGVPMNAVTIVDGYKCYRTASAVMITGVQEFTVA